MRNRLFIFSALGAVLILINSCGMDDTTVAKVGDLKITRSEFESRLNQRGRNAQKADATRDSVRKATLLNRMIEEKLKINAAYDMNLDEDEKILGSMKGRKSRLVGNKYFERIVVDQLISEQELKEAFNKQKEEVKASHILIAYKGALKSRAQRSKAEAKQLAQELAQRVKSGESLSKLAEQYSDDPTAKRNKGDLGYFTYGKMVPEFQEAAYKMEKGEVSGPVESGYGFHIIKLDDRRTNENFNESKFEEQKMNLKRQMYMGLQDSGRVLWNQHSKSLKEKYDFELLEENIRKAAEIAKEKNEKGLRTIGDYTQEEKDLVLAEFKGGNFTLGDLLIVYADNFSRVRNKLANFNNLKSQVENFGLNELMLLDAEHIGITEEEDIKSQLQQLLERQMLSEVQKRAIEGKVDVSEEEVRAYYEEHTDEFMQPATMEMWEIYVEDKNMADRVARMAQNGEDFERLAKKFSEDKFLQKKGGYLGYKQKNRRGAVSRKAFELGSGKVSDPIKFRSGWAVVKTGEKKDKTLKSYEDASSRARTKLKNQKRSNAREEWENELREKYEVTINHDLVEKL